MTLIEQMADYLGHDIPLLYAKASPAIQAYLVDQLQSEDNDDFRSRCFSLYADCKRLLLLELEDLGIQVSASEEELQDGLFIEALIFLREVLDKAHLGQQFGVEGSWRDAFTNWTEEADPDNRVSLLFDTLEQLVPVCTDKLVRMEDYIRIQGTSLQAHIEQMLDDVYPVQAFDNFSSSDALSYIAKVEQHRSDVMEIADKLSVRIVVELGHNYAQLPTLVQSKLLRSHDMSLVAAANLQFVTPEMVSSQTLILPKQHLLEEPHHNAKSVSSLVDMVIFLADRIALAPRISLADIDAGVFSVETQTEPWFSVSLKVLRAYIAGGV